MHGTTDEVTVRAFEPRDAFAFRTLNLAWIAQEFAVEPADRACLDDPTATILAPGGAILVAEHASLGRVVGTVALVVHAPYEFELAKMVVDPAYRGHGLGRRLIDAAIALARARGASSLYLESNARLHSALRLYERAGFRHLAPDERPVSPYARADVFMRCSLTAAAAPVTSTADIA